MISGRTQERAAETFVHALSSNEYDSFNRAANLLPDDYSNREESFSSRLRSCLSSFLTDFDRNKFRIAVVLSFIDSRSLDEETRAAIGLAPHTAEQSNSGDNLPQLHDPTRGLVTTWGSLCGNSESYLLKNTRANCGKTLYDVFGCLYVKSIGLVAGICYHTKEFANGATFIEGIWYLAREHEFIDQVLTKSPIPRRKQLMRNLSGENKPIKWNDYGGTWQPARAFMSPYSMDSRYTPEQLDNLLNGRISAEELYHLLV